MIEAIIFPPRSAPVSNATVTTSGDKNGVMLTIQSEGDRWDVYIPTASARRLIYNLHDAVMDAIQSEIAA